MAILIRRRTAAARFLAAVLVAAGLSSAHSLSQTAPAPPLEAGVKAAFLYNFAKFIDWPASISVTPDKTFVIGVVGDTPVLAALSSLEGSEIKGRRLVVRRFVRPEVAACHVLFVDAAQTAAFAQEAAGLREVPILTVGEGDEFLKAGGMIAFVKDGGKMRYRVRAHAAEAARLSISSKLLNLADRTGE